MHFLKSFAVLSACLQLSGGEKINSKMFAVQSGTSDVLSTKHLLFSSNQPSVVACAFQCFHESACVSFTFTGRVKHPGVCGGHSKTMTPSDAKTGAVTFGLLETAAWRMQTCSSVVDCGSIPDVDCLQHKCVCTPGYVYSASLNRCIDDCPVPYLTAGFSEYYEMGIAGYNLRTLYVDADGCKQACVQETDFTCLHVEWNFTDNQCHLTNVTALTAPASWVNDDDGWISWQRNCL